MTGARIDEAQLRKLYAQGWSRRDIADRLDASEKGVDRAVKRLGLPARGKGWQGFRVRVDDATVRRLHAEGLTQTAIAERLGVSQTWVSTRLRHLGLTKERPKRAPAITAVAGAGNAGAVRTRTVCGALDGWTVHHEARLMQARGYADLRALAAEWGLPMQTVMARYHRVRAAA